MDMNLAGIDITERKQESVGGLSCVDLPTYMAAATGRLGRQQVGDACKSIEYHMQLKADWTVANLQPDMVQHISWWHYDIQLGWEPDPKLFDIEHSFAIYPPRPPKK